MNKKTIETKIEEIYLEKEKIIPKYINNPNLKILITKYYSKRITGLLKYHRFQK